VFLGWAVLGAILAGLFLRQTGPHEWPWIARLGVRVGVGYVVLALIGLCAESIFAWVKRSRGRVAAEAKRSAAEERRRAIPCNLVQIDVDSYEFHDDVGKTFDPDQVFRGKPPTWPARVDPSSFLFADGEAYRDVKLIVDAPDGPGPEAVFNVSVRQGGVPSGGVTVTITRGA
jgi:hypothetical protein